MPLGILVHMANILAPKTQCGEKFDERFCFFKSREETKQKSFTSDREQVTAETLITLEIRVSDDSGNECRVIVRIRLLPPGNQPPMFVGLPFNFSAPCGPPSGREVGQVVAQDAPGSQLTYSRDGVDAILFAIDAQTGVITTSVALDPGSGPFVITVTVTDEAGLAAVTDVIIQLDPNDPQCNLPPIGPTCSGPVDVALAEASPVSTLVGQVVATGADIGGLTFDIVAGNTDNDFVINRQTGFIAVARPLSAARTPLYELMVRVTDANGRSCSVIVRIRIVPDQQQQPPTFIGIPYDFLAPCGPPAGRPVGQARAQASDNSQITYSLDGTDSALFSIDAATGAITTAAPLTPGTGPFLVTVTATDANGLSATTTVTIRLNPNDAQCAVGPTCSGPVDLAVSEASPVATRIEQIVATDDDFGGLRYEIVSGNTDDDFAIDSRTGVIAIARPLDRERTPTYVLTVRVTDATGRSCSVRVSITVIDNNDNPPLFQGEPYVFDVRCRQINAQVGRVTATDADIG